MSDITLRRVKHNELEAFRPLLCEVYADVYADELDDPFNSIERFNERLTGHANGNGWEAVIGYSGTEPVGYAYASALRPEARWWKSQLLPLPADFAAETGQRTLALFEIMLRAPWRGIGLAHRIHEELLSERREERVTLLVDPTHAGVKRLYESWGYIHIGDQKPFPDSPVYATMVRHLRDTHHP